LVIVLEKLSICCDENLFVHQKIVTIAVVVAHVVCGVGGD
jgi:hypothetical protein